MSRYKKCLFFWQEGHRAKSHNDYRNLTKKKQRDECIYTYFQEQDSETKTWIFKNAFHPWERPDCQRTSASFLLQGA